MTVYNLKIGQTAKVKEVLGDSKLAKRLLALGCVSGTEIEIKRSAPLGDPIVVSFRGTDLAIRRKDASNIYLEM